MSGEGAVEVRRLSFSYGGEQVLTDVDFTIERGEFISVVGPNGGGKTTLARLLLGLLRPESGTLCVLGTTPRRARSRIGYVAQSNQFDLRFPVNALDVVLMGRLGHAPLVGRYRRRDREAARGALDQVGMADAARRPLSDLSGGQRQRVLIARALAAEPELLLLDEPTANLDQQTEKGLYELLAHLAGTLTIVLVSHDLRFVTGHIRRALCVHRTVAVHPTSAIDERVIREMYGPDVRMIRHDHHLEGTGE